jgi:hypothetical protein
MLSSTAQCRLVHWTPQADEQSCGLVSKVLFLP